MSRVTRVVWDFDPNTALKKFIAVEAAQGWKYLKHYQHSENGPVKILFIKDGKKRLAITQYRKANEFWSTEKERELEKVAKESYHLLDDAPPPNLMVILTF